MLPTAPHLPGGAATARATALATFHHDYTIASVTQLPNILQEHVIVAVKPFIAILLIMTSTARNCEQGRSPSGLQSGVGRGKGQSFEGSAEAKSCGAMPKIER